MEDPSGGTEHGLKVVGAPKSGGAADSHGLKPKHQVSASEAAYSVLFIMTTLSAAWYGLDAITGVMIHDRANFADFAYAYHHAIGNTFVAYLFTRIYAVVHLIDEKAHDDFLIGSLPSINSGVERLCRLAAVLWVIVVFKPYEPLLNALSGFPGLQSLSLWFGDLATRLSFALADSSFGRALFDNNAIVFTNIERFHTYEVEHTYVKGTVGLALMLIVFAFILWDLFVFVLNLHKVELQSGSVDDQVKYHQLWTESTRPWMPFSVTRQIFEWVSRQIQSTDGAWRFVSCAASVVVRLVLYFLSWKCFDRLVLLSIAAIISRSDFQILLPVSALFPFLALITVATGVYFHRTFLDEFFDLMLSPATFVINSQYGRPVGGILIFAAILWPFIGPLRAIAVGVVLLSFFVALAFMGARRGESDNITQQNSGGMEGQNG